MLSLLYRAGSVLFSWLMINALDMAPQSLKRRVLQGEYQGEMLEKRLSMKIGGGLSMLLALWRMASINMVPELHVGDPITTSDTFTEVQKGSIKSEVNLGEQHRPKVPLLINFGSCS